MDQIDKEKLESAIDFINSLSKGYDPISNSYITEDTVFKNKNYLMQFSYIAQALQFLLNNVDMTSQKSYNAKLTFCLSEDEIKQITISNEPISVSKLTYNINEVADINIVRKLKATQITEWLTLQGYLQIDRESETSHKICTDRAKELGIITVEKENEYGNKYKVNLFDEYAQRYIIDNINIITNVDP